MEGHSYDRSLVSSDDTIFACLCLCRVQQVYMTAVRGGGCIGVSYYRTDTMELYMMPDVDETDNFDILKKGASSIFISLSV